MDRGFSGRKLGEGVGIWKGLNGMDSNVPVGGVLAAGTYQDFMVANNNLEETEEVQRLEGLFWQKFRRFTLIQKTKQR